jgi:hypothetical protein
VEYRDLRAVDEGTDARIGHDVVEIADWRPALFESFTIHGRFFL